MYFEPIRLSSSSFVAYGGYALQTGTLRRVYPIEYLSPNWIICVERSLTYLLTVAVVFKGLWVFFCAEKKVFNFMIKKYWNIRVGIKNILEIFMLPILEVSDLSLSNFGLSLMWNVSFFIYFCLSGTMPNQILRNFWKIQSVGICEIRVWNWKVMSWDLRHEKRSRAMRNRL